MARVAGTPGWKGWKGRIPTLVEGDWVLMAVCCEPQRTEDLSLWYFFLFLTVV
jgi:hypothetical protein